MVAPLAAFALWHARSRLFHVGRRSMLAAKLKGFPATRPKDGANLNTARIWSSQFGTILTLETS
jgi:hypothetical protein